MSKYSEWVRTLPCCVSGYVGDEVDPHHVKGMAWLTGAGMAKKGSDLTCIPLRHDLHQSLHDMGWVTWEKLHNVSQLELMIKTILRAEKEGIITL